MSAPELKDELRGKQFATEIAWPSSSSLTHFYFPSSHHFSFPGA
jgi:hypothetical protein